MWRRTSITCSASAQAESSLTSACKHARTLARGCIPANVCTHKCARTRARTHAWMCTTEATRRQCSALRRCSLIHSFVASEGACLVDYCKAPLLLRVRLQAMSHSRRMLSARLLPHGRQLRLGTVPCVVPHEAYHSTRIGIATLCGMPCRAGYRELQIIRACYQGSWDTPHLLEPHDRHAIEPCPHERRAPEPNLQGPSASTTSNAIRDRNGTNHSTHAAWRTTRSIMLLSCI